MRVGFVNSSRNILLSIKKNLILILAMTFLYAINALAIGEISLPGGGDFRPLVFVPALAAIIFGPAVGSFSAAFGNLIIDIINDTILSSEGLDLGNLAGFLGNFIGAAVVGFLSWRLKFKKDDRVLLSGKIWLRYLQNTLAAIVGMGLVTGVLIYLLQVGFYVRAWDAAMVRSVNVFYNNTLILFVTILPLQILVGIYEKLRARNYDKALNNSRNVTIVEEPINPSAIIDEFKIIPGVGIDGLI